MISADGQRRFETIARSRLDWFRSAQRLWEAAELLFISIPPELRVETWADRSEGWEAISPFTGPLGPFLVLAALSLENLVRGIRIQNDPSLVRPDDEGRMRIAAEIANHNLVELAEPCLPTTPEERRVLQLLSEASVGYGRRSLPIHHEIPVWLGPVGKVDGNVVSKIFTELYERWSDELMRHGPRATDHGLGRESCVHPDRQHERFEDHGRPWLARTEERLHAVHFVHLLRGIRILRSAPEVKDDRLHIVVVAAVAQVETGVRCVEDGVLDEA
jgi:hypothetical protein